MTKVPLSRPRTRRELLKLSPALLLGAFAVPSWQQPLLDAGLSLSDRASAFLFRPNHLAPTFADRDVVSFEAFPYNYFDVVDPGVDLENWTLTVSGAVSRPGAYRLAQIQALPLVRQNTRHVCVEGWDVVGRFGGARISEFLDLIGADRSARFVVVTCADGYYESLDMATARHPQSLLCHEMYDRPLDRGHGAPLRLQMPTTLGYKQAKYLMTLEVAHVLPARRSYWGDEGYSWYGGL
ncbi:MAG: molybdopterin-dependent oxidoreductase [Vicinamibacterales bacterium]